MEVGGERFVGTSEEFGHDGISGIRIKAAADLGVLMGARVGDTEFPAAVLVLDQRTLEVAVRNFEDERRWLHKSKRLNLTIYGIFVIAYQ